MSDASPQSSPTRRVLALRPGAIGDTLLTYPALLHVRARYPNAPIHLVGNPAAAPILAAQRGPDGEPLLVGWTPFDDPAVTGLFLPNGPSERATRTFAPLVAAVAWCADPDGVLKANLHQVGAGPVVVAASRPESNGRIHVADHLLSTLNGLEAHTGSHGSAPDPLDAPEPIEPGLSARSRGYPPLEVNPRWAADADAFLTRLGVADRPFVLIHPGSGSPTKNWPAERFARVAAAVPEALGAAPLLLAGPAEDDAVRRVIAALPSPVPVIRELPLTAVSGAIRRARAYLGNDSGLTHLAGLLGVPTLALFGPTDPVMWSPLGPRVRVLRRQPLDALELDEVLAELDRVRRVSR